MSRQTRRPKAEPQEKVTSYIVRMLGHCPATDEAAAVTITYRMLSPTVTIAGYKNLDPVTQKALATAARRQVDNVDQAFRALLSQYGAEREAVDSEATEVEPAKPAKAPRQGPRELSPAVD